MNFPGSECSFKYSLILEFPDVCKLLFTLHVFESLNYVIYPVIKNCPQPTEVSHFHDTIFISDFVA